MSRSNEPDEAAAKRVEVALRNEGVPPPRPAVVTTDVSRLRRFRAAGMITRKVLSHEEQIAAGAVCEDD